MDELISCFGLEANKRRKTHLDPHFERAPGPFLGPTPLLVEGAPVVMEAIPAVTPAAIEKSTSEREPAVTTDVLCC